MVQPCAPHVTAVIIVITTIVLEMFRMFMHWETALPSLKHDMYTYSAMI